MTITYTVYKMCAKPKGWEKYGYDDFGTKIKQINI